MTKTKRIIMGIIAGLLVVSLLFGLVISVFGASSSTIKQQIEDLKKKESAVKEKRSELQSEIKQSEGKELDLVQQKSQIDQQITLVQEEIDIKNDEIRQYNLLIAEKQNELDDAIADKNELDSKYQQRVRAMEENGKISYWSTLFKASSFADMLDRVDMINEIADADVRMLKNLQDAATAIEESREELAAEKLELEQAKTDLSAKEEELGGMREESDKLLNELIKDIDTLRSAEEKYEAMESELSDQMAAKEKELTAAIKKEQEAAAAAAAAAAAQHNNSGNSGSGNSGSGNSGSGNSGSGNSGGGSSSSASFIRPVSGGYISSAYGYRYHPISGSYSFHNGVDIAVAAGTPIKAAASGTVTVNSFSYAWGNYVTINHGNGFSTLYAHMTNYIVSYKQYVTQGQVIGYVGSTGYSTGPHLHFTMYYNGSTVNPMNYIG